MASSKSGARSFRDFRKNQSDQQPDQIADYVVYVALTVETHDDPLNGLNGKRCSDSQGDPNRPKPQKPHQDSQRYEERDVRHSVERNRSQPIGTPITVKAGDRVPWIARECHRKYAAPNNNKQRGNGCPFRSSPHRPDNGCHNYGDRHDNGYAGIESWQ